MTQSCVRLTINSKQDTSFLSNLCVETLTPIPQNEFVLVKGMIKSYCLLLGGLI